jgi:hypothetical protein
LKPLPSLAFRATLGVEMDIATVLRSGIRLEANPHRYDYIHMFELKEDGQVEMVDGGGQVLRRQINGRYEIKILGPTEAEVRFYDLRDVDPYGRSQETRDLDALTARVVLEKGPFAYECEVVWHVKPGEDPYVVFQERLAFDRDPLHAGMEQMPEFPPEALEIPEFREFIERHKRAVEAGRRYYSVQGKVEIPHRELVKLDLPPECIHRLQ